MNSVPARVRQEGTQTSASLTMRQETGTWEPGAGQVQSPEDLDLQDYWRDCQLEGERLLNLYRRITLNRSYGEQRSVLKSELLKHQDLVPRLRELIAAVDQELLSLNRFTDSDRAQHAELLHYRTGLVSLWDIVSPYLLKGRK